MATLNGIGDHTPALAFDSAGTLFGVRIDNSLASRPTELITVNTASGAVSVRGPSGQPTRGDRVRDAAHCTHCSVGYLQGAGRDDRWYRWE